MVSRALDADNYVAMAGIDLSAAFDVVDTVLLIRRLKIIGLPDDVIKLIEVWLTERFFYVSMGNDVSTTKHLQKCRCTLLLKSPINNACFVHLIMRE